MLGESDGDDGLDDGLDNGIGLMALCFNWLPLKCHRLK